MGAAQAAAPRNDSLPRRIAFAVIAMPIALGIIYAGGWVLTALVAVTAVLGVRELYAFAIMQGTRPLVRTGLVSALVLPFLTYAGLTAWPELKENATYIGALWLLAVILVGLARRASSDRPLAALAITVFGVAYAGALPCFLLDLRHLPNRGTFDVLGGALVTLPLIVTWVGDTAAMFGGKLFGGPKLAPRVSPGKTRSGAICGMLASMAAAALFAGTVLRPLGLTLSLGQALLFGAVVSVLGQAGDLAESLLKREVGLKDSSALIPGHGGVLDRLDSLYFALPTAAALYRLFGVA
jgi:phosphatidate cytidylyltransferase